MELKIRISEICKAAGIKNAYELAKKSNLKMPTAYRAFANDIKQFTPETLAALCNALECTPNDIFGYTTPQKSAPTSDTPRPAKTPSASNTAAQMEGMLTTQQAADRLGIGRRTLNEHISKGRLPSTKGRGNHHFISEADLAEFERSRKADN